MRLFDSHCHLQDRRLLPEIDAVLNRAQAAGVAFAVCSGSTENDWVDVLALAHRHPMVIPALGIHPWYASERSESWFENLEAALRQDNRIAVGEIGLDHALDKRDDDDQMRLFHRQLTLAQRLQRPASIHCRKAWGSLTELLRREPGIVRGCVIHSYSGPPELVEELQNYGLCLSFSGSLTYRRNRRARESLLRVDAEHLLFETDSPDISPDGHSGYNEPATIVKVVDEAAKITGRNADAVADAAFCVGCRVFGVK